jgi:hypothetical protein
MIQRTYLQAQAGMRQTSDETLKQLLRDWEPGFTKSDFESFTDGILTMHPIMTDDTSVINTLMRAAYDGDVQKAKESAQLLANDADVLSASMARTKQLIDLTDARDMVRLWSEYAELISKFFSMLDLDPRGDLKQSLSSMFDKTGFTEGDIKSFEESVMTRHPIMMDDISGINTLVRAAYVGDAQKVKEAAQLLANNDEALRASMARAKQLIYLTKARSKKDMVDYIESKSLKNSMMQYVMMKDFLVRAMANRIEGATPWYIYLAVAWLAAKQVGLIS